MRARRALFRGWKGHDLPCAPAHGAAWWRRFTPGDDERGVALVEGAILMVPFFLVIFGIFEFGLAFKDHLTVANATRAGARVASAAAADGDADFAVVQAIKKASAAMPAASIERIVVFHAASVDSEVPAGCAGGSPSAVTGAECNVYTSADFDVDRSSFGGCMTHGDAVTPLHADRFFCPRARVVTETPAPDLVGVWVKANHEYVTGLFGSTFTITDTTIMRIEPRRRA